ncbi:MAG: hypothetical protein IPK44_06230 [Candidatus Accumulibacter sp.]|uniref:hypothetical protein n=1 Tax=Accumulibacter sp. TaxID=2053492 RepID=UPI00258718C1|nr:hypothetical protein [Accumulibacter sp.]MBK8114156.1 hypothetical protein [Accumulibacter sp.]
MPASSNAQSEGSLAFDGTARQITIEVGAIIFATGALEKQDVPAAFAGLADVHTWLQLRASAGDERQ